MQRSQPSGKPDSPQIAEAQVTDEDDHDHHNHEAHDDYEDDGHDADEHEDHTNHDDHASREHDNHDDDEQGVIKVTPRMMKEFGIEVEQARGGTIGRTIRLPGVVVFNADRIAHVTPTVSGIVQDVNVSAGDEVDRGESIAVLTSRELAATRSEYLAAKARLDLANENLRAGQTAL